MSVEDIVPQVSDVAKRLTEEESEQPDLSYLFQNLSPSQQRYLAHLPQGENTEATCKIVGLAPSTIRLWRKLYPAFKQAEVAIKERTATYAVTLARTLFAVAAPVTTLKVIERANGPVESDRQLVTAQKAAETVLKAAGVLSDTPQLPGEVERVDVLAMRLWMKKKSDG